MENGYKEEELGSIIEEIKRKRPLKRKDPDDRYTSLPWIPDLSQKLHKVFKKAGCKVSFKSPRNLESILTNKNKPQLPPNSQPGVYFIPTGCASGYTGESKKQVQTRNLEHEKAVFKGDTKNDAIAEHKEKCDCEIDWKAVKTLAVEPLWFKRKVREALEIRRLKTGPNEPKGLNRDLGDYVTTSTWSTLFDKINSKNIVPTFESMTSNNYRALIEPMTSVNNDVI